MISLQKKLFPSRGASLLLVLLAGVSGSAVALQPLITDDTGTQGSGGNQLELSYGHDRTRVDGETERVDTVPVVYTYGLTETLDIYGGADYSRIRHDFPGGDADGFGNPVVGLKWRFYEIEGSGTSFAIKPEILIPVSSNRERDGLGVGKTSANLTFVVSQEMPFGSLHFNAGVGRERFRHSDDSADTTYRRFSVAPVWDISEQWKLALDMGVELARTEGDTVRSKFVEAGAIYSPNKDLDLAIGYIRTTDDERIESKTNTVTVGVTWRF